MVNNIRTNTISEISAKKDSNTLNKIKNAKIRKYKKCTPKNKELLNLFNDLLDTILTDKILESESQEDKNENYKNENLKNKKISTNTKKDENENMLLEYIEDVDDKLFKKHSNGKKIFNSFINEFDHATNEEGK